MSDSIWKDIIAGCVAIILAWLSLRNQKKLNAVAVTVEKTAVTGDKTHALVNSGWGVQLRLGAELSRWKADREPTEANVKAAELAEKTLREHDAKQAVVDGKPQP